MSPIRSRRSTRGSASAGSSTSQEEEAVDHEESVGTIATTKTPRRAALNSSESNNNTTTTPTKPSTPVKRADTSITKTLRPHFEKIYTLKDADGDEISPVFQTLPPRSLTQYFKVIQRPMSLFLIKTNLNHNKYTSPSGFIRDLVQITWNARLFNLKKSEIYEYALILDRYIHEVIEKLKATKKFSPAELEYPDLGPLPDGDEEEIGEDEEGEEEENVDKSLKPKRGPGRKPRASNNDDDDDDEDEDEDDEEDEDDDEEEEEEDDDDEDAKKPAKRGRPPRNSVGRKKRKTSIEPDSSANEKRKKRGRPPTVDKPHEHRIKAIMRGIRKIKEPGTMRLIYPDFEKLPDPKVSPEYYAEVQDPIGLDTIRKNIKRRKYPTVDLFLNDMRRMFYNAKLIHGEGSVIYNEAVLLEQHMDNLTKDELAKPDSVYQDPDANSKISRLPLDNVEHNGVLYRVGDWVHIRNPNQGEKPIIGQIFRMWRASDGNEWINACWYYRPEQTVHKYDKLFYENEVVKSGQYRDHLVADIIDKCFVMFFTKYQRGRPKGIGNGMVYCCESRYNENEKIFNKIRTWKACIPDEIRSTDYPMDLFDRVVPLRRVASPIKHLLKKNARDDDPIPEPTMGATNAPPLIGAVYKRPYDPADPPEQPTPVDPNEKPPGFISSPDQKQRVFRTPSVSNMSSQAAAAAAMSPDRHSPMKTQQQQQQFQQRQMQQKFQQQQQQQVHSRSQSVSSTGGRQTPTSQMQFRNQMSPPATPGTPGTPGTPINATLQLPNQQTSQQYIANNGMRFQQVPPQSAPKQTGIPPPGTPMVAGPNGIPVPAMNGMAPQFIMGPNGMPVPVAGGNRGYPVQHQQQMQQQQQQQQQQQYSQMMPMQGPMMGQFMQNTPYGVAYQQVGFNPQMPIPSPLPGHIVNGGMTPQQQQQLLANMPPSAQAVAQAVVPPPQAPNNFITSPPHQMNPPQNHQQQQPPQQIQSPSPSMQQKQPQIYQQSQIPGIPQSMSPVVPGMVPAPGPPTPVPYIQAPPSSTPGGVYNPQQFAQAGVNPPAGPLVVQPSASPPQPALAPAVARTNGPPQYPPGLTAQQQAAAAHAAQAAFHNPQQMQQQSQQSSQMAASRMQMPPHAQIPPKSIQPPIQAAQNPSRTVSKQPQFPPTQITIKGRDGQTIIPTAFTIPETSPDGPAPELTLNYPDDSPLAKLNIVLQKPPEPNGAPANGTIEKVMVAWFPTPPIYVARHHVSDPVGRNISGLVFEKRKEEHAEDNEDKEHEETPNGSVNKETEQGEDEQNEQLSPESLQKLQQLEDEQRGTFVLGHSAKYLAWKRAKLAAAPASKATTAKVTEVK